MNPTRIFLLAGVAGATLTSSLVQAQETPVAPAAPQQAAAQEDPLLAHLDEEQTKEFWSYIQTASKHSTERKSLEALVVLEDASKLAPKHFAVQNLMGVSHMTLREFDKARNHFSLAREVAPDNVGIRFNLAEVDFCSQNFEAALDQFTKIVEDNPKLPSQMFHLFRYKQIICLLKLDRTPEAEKLLAEFNAYESTPIYHMSQAAMEFSKGNQSEAQGWILSTRSIYPTEVDTYLDALMECGWVDSLMVPKVETGG